MQPAAIQPWPPSGPRRVVSGSEYFLLIGNDREDAAVAKLFE
jgi:hypothetical protein